jgi:hypothetical protein
MNLCFLLSEAGTAYPIEASSLHGRKYKQFLGFVVSTSKKVICNYLNNGLH